MYRWWLTRITQRCSQAPCNRAPRQAKHARNGQPSLRVVLAQLLWPLAEPRVHAQLAPVQLGKQILQRAFETDSGADAAMAHQRPKGARAHLHLRTAHLTAATRRPRGGAGRNGIPATVKARNANTEQLDAIYQLQCNSCLHHLQGQSNVQDAAKAAQSKLAWNAC